MINHINYDDDLFFITARLQIMEKSLKLNLDSELLAESYRHDILAYDKLLSLFQEKLTSNTQLIRLSEYLHALHRAQICLVAIIDTLLAGSLPFAQSFQDERSLLSEIHKRQVNNSHIITDRLSKGVENFKELDVIGEEELSILMADETEEPDEEQEK
jgi:hypothetical protein